MRYAGGQGGWRGMKTPHPVGENIISYSSESRRELLRGGIRRAK